MTESQVNKIKITVLRKNHSSQKYKYYFEEGEGVVVVQDQIFSTLPSNGRTFSKASSVRGPDKQVKH